MSVFTNPADAAPSAAKDYIQALLELLGDRDPLAVLTSTSGELQALVRGRPESSLRRPEAPGRWSVGGVLAHLADSELVWGWRLRMVLAEDRPTLGGYDQDAWARRLDYASLEPRASLDRFDRARRWNLDLIGRTADAGLDRVGVHAERGEESVRHMIRLYAGHDLVHLAQARRILAGMEREEREGKVEHDE